MKKLENNRKTFFATFRNLCAWGMIWIFFVMLPLQSIRLVIKENREPAYKFTINMEATNYCSYVAYFEPGETIIGCVARLGKRAGLEETFYEMGHRLEAAAGIVRDMNGDIIK